MARVRDKGSILNQLSGKVGELVFKKYGDVVIVSKVPDMSSRKLSEKQIKRNEIMKSGSKYAKAMSSDLKTKYALAAKLGVPPNRVYNAIMSYYLKHDGDLEKLLELQDLS
ncbi:hypothetical protein [Flavihumibacter petaseus]|uniref:Uncharacterized protein n=1 Tax=Flavihumibacter petaseus NBRC 106054 TaxID=1220578 RepID=A0A0E9N6Y8_9BACT|nr:hypothetical protein [Flavihumibacter petaseus]GAO45712.1 hypothetical protein FPE01S_08_00320 [Flavihumibacter petaseus NBRC 106054]